MRQCNPLVICGRSLPKRALTTSAPCPAGTTGNVATEGPEWICTFDGGSDCSIGPLGATAADDGGERLCAGPGGTEGTSLGGRSTGVLAVEEPLKNCACAGIAR